jgi:predicted pyridoxine 5'-phosphate oxidase superfamily flavin-nucleotide-binding protein
MNNSCVQQTVTKITQAEVDLTITRALALLTTLSIRAGYSRLYATHDKDICKRDLIYLYIYFLQMWNYTVDAYNFSSAAQMTSVVADLQQLLYDKSCDNSIDYSGTVSVQFVPVPNFTQIKVPASFRIVITAEGMGVTDAQLLGLMDTTTVFLNNQVVQTGWTINGTAGTISFANLTLYPDDVITGDGAKFFQL